MKCISVQQPWAWALFHGKDVENRTWAPKYRGDLLIHAAKKFDHEGWKWIRKHFPGLLEEDGQYFLERGKIIGKVTMDGIVIHSSSPWFSGPYGHVYKNPIEFKEPIPYRGRLHLFDVPDELVKHAICANSQTERNA